MKTQETEIAVDADGGTVTHADNHKQPQTDARLVSAIRAVFVLEREADRAYLEQQIARFKTSVCEFLERDDERKKIGRLLVEERARSLDGARQIHQLKENDKALNRRLNSAVARAEKSEEAAAEFAARLEATERRLDDAKNELTAAERRAQNAERLLTVAQHGITSSKARVETVEQQLIETQNVVEFLEGRVSRISGDVRIAVQRMCEAVQQVESALLSLTASRVLNAAKLVSNAPMETVSRALLHLEALSDALKKLEQIPDKDLEHSSNGCASRTKPLPRVFAQ